MNRFFSSLFRRADKTPNFSIEFEHTGIDHEDMVDWQDDEADSKLAGMRLGLIYRDADNKITRRIVRLKRLRGGHYEGYLTAYCELRREERTFLISRIQTLYDPSTGELLSPAVDFFGSFFDEREAEMELRAERSKFRLAWPIIEALRNETQVLVLVARSDNRFVKAEQNAILKYVVLRAGDLGLSVGDDAQIVLRDWIRLQDPSEAEARIAIKALARSPDGLDAVWEVVQLVAESDGKVTPQEMASISEIRKTIELVALDKS